VAATVLYETLKSIHIIGTTVVVGGGVLITALLASAVIGRNGERIQAVSSIGAWVGPRVFAPAWALVLAFGIWTTLEGNLSFGDAWITIGFVVFAIALALGPSLHERHAKQMAAAIEEHRRDSTQALSVGKRELAVSFFEATLLIFTIWAMTAKPGF
jgi:uncharacterized membrane protein